MLIGWGEDGEGGCAYDADMRGSTVVVLLMNHQRCDISGGCMINLSSMDGAQF